ncbi:MAG TPA: ATP-binding protein [Mariniphaga anaerophila]|uniref:ATP-binding protein n=1 Tax=Mariniphaga anaerophila TaxID=1484053 RepID=A0A831PRM8_9BACT|nr:ATP-binding protein [Mariniphaga anaerophila]
MTNVSEILTINSDKKSLEKVEKFLFRVFEKYRLPQKCFSKVLLCVSEAVINSIEHGNKNDLQKEVVIHIECKNDNICVEVRDEGDGFNFQNLDNPTLAENLKKEAGRGIHIIKSLCTQVKFRNDGKCVQIKIDLQ